ncbi:dolichol kinase [Gottschalkia purinilytica]|uniref:Dolichol kinase n=1 Tax=Gottschalkia purinilytica TaxID=1503 RepID=A0A0L0WAB4_GOTPU|nr:hypothetical protein [Gottschalkia purinilytica]KNF08255.1 dolichol kinase [Gottschalkia purinilytica]
MGRSLIGIIVSIIFVFLIIGISTVLTNLKIISGEWSRKFIHIAVCNWWIAAMYFFDSPLEASIVPALFVFVNYISYKKQLFKAMERDGSKNDLGSVYYAISLLILSILTFRDSSYAYVGGIGIFTLGYGDGFAAAVGSRYGKRRYKVGNVTKSVEGTLAMFIFSFLAIFITLSIYNPNNTIVISLILALFATLVEAITPFGLDNLTVPLLTPIVYLGLLKIF